MVLSDCLNFNGGSCGDECGGGCGVRGFVWLLNFCGGSGGGCRGGGGGDGVRT